MKPSTLGSIAEEKVAEFLGRNGYKIVGRNWKTKQCEIDIVAEKDKCIYFVEVKYRKDDGHGDGFDYITPTKLKQMSFAADLWVSKNKWKREYVLSGASVIGDDFQIEFIEQI